MDNHPRIRPEVLFRLFAFLTLIVLGSTLLVYRTSSQTKMPDTITLAKEAKLGPVTFNHLKHATENRSPDGTKKIECVECHHTAQPASEAVKHPPHKTAWPADRTTTLTAELLDKDATIVVNACTDCHARADQKPKLIPEIPSVKFEGAAEATLMNNQQAFHHACGGCHDDAVKARPTLDPAPPTSKKCVACHKKVAA
jgi:class III cytochrome C family protein